MVKKRKGDREHMVYPATRRRGDHDVGVLGVCRVIWVCIRYSVRDSKTLNKNPREKPHRLLGPPHRRRANPLQNLRLSASRPHVRWQTVHRFLLAPRAFCHLWLCPVPVLVQGVFAILLNFGSFDVQPQVDVQGFPEEPINPLAANSEGSYIVGRGSMGGDCLRNGMLTSHYRGVSYLVFSDDGTLLISGSEDGGIGIWSWVTTSYLIFLYLYIVFNYALKTYLYLLNLTGYLMIIKVNRKATCACIALRSTLCLTVVVVGYGGCKAIIVSASQDPTSCIPCKSLNIYYMSFACYVWSVGSGRLLRNIVFPTIIDAIALDPGENVFFAGGRDGKIYVAALNAGSPLNSKYGFHLIDCFSNHRSSIFLRNILKTSNKINVLMSRRSSFCPKAKEKTIPMKSVMQQPTTGSRNACSFVSLSISLPLLRSLAALATVRQVALFVHPGTASS
ncbi:unnamed protein product [Malus baccata var. baccata]